MTRQDATVGVVEAARILGITTDAVRAKLRRGTIEGHKIDGEWHVVIPAPQSVRQDATGERQDADRTPTVDLAPLVTHIAALEDQLQRLTEASTMWQVRARQAEEQLQALTAGTTKPETTGVASESPRSDEPPATGIRAWVRRLWRG